MEPPDIRSVPCKMILKTADVFYGKFAVSGIFSRFCHGYLILLYLLCLDESKVPEMDYVDYSDGIAGMKNYLH